MNCRPKGPGKEFLLKITAKFAAAASAALIAAAASAFAQGTGDYNLPQGFWFYNEVSSDVVKSIGNISTSNHDGGKKNGEANGNGDVIHDGSNDFNWQARREADNDETAENWMSEFGGLKEKIGVGYNSEKFYLDLGAQFGLQDNNQNFFNGNFVGYGVGTAASDSRTDGTRNYMAYKENNSHRGLNADDLSFAWTDFWWHIRFTPFDIVDFDWNYDEWIPGGYLPGADEHLSGSNLAGSGVAVVVKPIDGLKLAADIPFSFGWSSGANYLDAEREDYNHLLDSGNIVGGTGWDTDVFEDYWFKLNLGAEYTLADFITVGGTITDVAHRQTRGYGLYVNANLGNIFANLGYSYKSGAVTVDDWDGLVRIHGNHKINAAGGVAFGDLTASLEALFNLPVLGSYSIYDLYAGVKASYDLVPNKFNVGLRVYTAMDIKHSSSYGHAGAFDLTDKNTTYDGTAGSSLSDQEKMAFWYLYWGQGKWNDAAEEVAKNVNADKYDKRTMLQCYGAAPMIGITPSVAYRTGKHEFSAAANLEYWLNGDGGYAVKFPVSWTWNFN